MNKVRLLFTGLVVIVLALAGGTAWLIYEYLQQQIPGQQATKQELQAIKTDTEKTKKDVLDLQQQHNLLKVRVDVLQGEVESHTVRLNNQDKVIKKLEDQGDSHAAELAEARKERAEIKDKLDQQQSDLDEQKKKMSDVEKKLEEQGAKIEAMQGRLDKADKRLDEKDREIADLKARLEEIETLLKIKPRQ